MADYPLIPGTLASNCWPADPQTLYNEMFAKGVAQVASGAIVGVIASASAPGTSDRDKLWLKLDGSDQPVGIYYYAAGLWLWPHPVPYSSSIRHLWVGSAAALLTFDGGTNTTVSAASGPFWEVDTDFEAKFPVGPGTMPGGTVIAVGDTGGEDAHTLLSSELPAHTHPVYDASTGAGAWYHWSYDSGSPDGAAVEPAWPNGGTSSDSTVIADSQTGTTGESFATLPPYRGIYIIKRTARQFWVG